MRGPLLGRAPTNRRLAGRPFMNYDCVGADHVRSHAPCVEIGEADGKCRRNQRPDVGLGAGHFRSYLLLEVQMSALGIYCPSLVQKIILVF